MKEQEYLSRILSVKYKDGAFIYVPFYIHKSDNHYQLLTPIMIEEFSGIKKTLKHMLADNLKDKIAQHIKPETESLDQLMEKLVPQI